MAERISRRHALAVGASALAAGRVSTAAAADWELEQPREGARWREGSRQVIRWKRGASSEPIGEDVELLWSTDGGKTWQSIGRALAEAGRFLWTVPSGTGSARVRVSSAGKALAESRVRLGPSAEVPEYRWEKITMIPLVCNMVYTGDRVPGILSYYEL